MLTKTFWIGCLLYFLAFVALANAQTAPTPNPTAGEFNVASNHNAIHTDGLPIVDHYEMEIVVVSNGALFLTLGIGKPQAADGARVTVPLPTLASTLTRDVIYYGIMVSVGPGGTGRSAPSNPFVVPSVAPAPGPPSGFAVR
jgi:hypothetical protein